MLHNVSERNVSNWYDVQSSQGTIVSKRQYAYFAICVFVSLAIGFLLGSNSETNRKRKEGNILDETPTVVSIKEPNREPVTLKVTRRGTIAKDASNAVPNTWRIVFTYPDGNGDILFCEVVEHIK